MVLEYLNELGVVCIPVLWRRGIEAEGWHKMGHGMGWCWMCMSAWKGCAQGGRCVVVLENDTVVRAI